MLSLGFTVGFSVFVLGFVDWAQLVNCHDEQTCHDLHHYVTTSHFGFSSLYGFIVMGKWQWEQPPMMYSVSNSVHFLQAILCYFSRIGFTAALAGFAMYLKELKWRDFTGQHRNCGGSLSYSSTKLYEAKTI
jgi:hypothetical protein